MLQYRVVYKETLELLKKLMQYDCLQDFFLVGGTSLALQLGHRISVDLDLFTTTNFNTADILKELKTNLEFQVILQNEKNSMIINAKQKGSKNELVKIDFVKYDYPLINEIQNIDNLRLISIEDITAMKLSAATNRGAKKDFFDIYELLKRYSVKEMMHFFSKKYPEVTHFHILKSLTYFEDAEDEFEPISLNNTNWEEVKTTIEQKINEFL